MSMENLGVRFMKMVATPQGQATLNAGVALAGEAALTGLAAVGTVVVAAAPVAIPAAAVYGLYKLFTS